MLTSTEDILIWLCYIYLKAAQYFEMKIVKVPVNEKKRSVNIKAMKKAITRNTVMVKT